MALTVPSATYAGQPGILPVAAAMQQGFYPPLMPALVETPRPEAIAPYALIAPQLVKDKVEALLRNMAHQPSPNINQSYSQYNNMPPGGGGGQWGSQWNGQQNASMGGQGNGQQGGGQFPGAQQLPRPPQQGGNTQPQQGMNGQESAAGGSESIESMMGGAEGQPGGSKQTPPPNKGPLRANDIKRLNTVLNGTNYTSRTSAARELAEFHASDGNMFNPKLRPEYGNFVVSLAHKVLTDPSTEVRRPLVAAMDSYMRSADPQIMRDLQQLSATADPQIEGLFLNSILGRLKNQPTDNKLASTDQFAGRRAAQPPGTVLNMVAS